MTAAKNLWTYMTAMIILMFIARLYKMKVTSLEKKYNMSNLRRKKKRGKHTQSLRKQDSQSMLHYIHSCTELSSLKSDDANFLLGKDNEDWNLMF
jgi:hypothetical protein